MKTSNSDKKLKNTKNIFNQLVINSHFYLLNGLEVFVVVFWVAARKFFGKVKGRSGMNDGGHPAANTEVSRGLLGARNAMKPVKMIWTT